MTKIVVEPSSLRRGAGTCADVAREASAAAARLRSLTPPPGTPGLVGPHVADATRHLGWAADSVGHQRAFLSARASLALAADGPFGTELNLTMPSLSDPWSAPLKIPEPKQHHGLLGKIAGGGWDFTKGFAGAGLQGVKSTAGLTAAVGAHAVDGDLGPAAPLMIYLHHKGLPRLSDHVPGMKGARRTLDGAVGVAVRHPGRAVKEMGKGLIDYDDWSHGRIMKALGNNTFTVLTLARTPGSASKTARGLKELNAAKREVTVSRVQEIAAAKRLSSLEAQRDAARAELGRNARGPAARLPALEDQLRRAQAEVNRLGRRHLGLQYESQLARRRLDVDSEALRKSAAGQAKGALEAYATTDPHKK